MTMPQRVEVLINTAGRTVTYKRFSTQSSTSTLKKSNTYVDYVVKAYVADYQPKDIVGQVQEGDRMVFLAARVVDFEPTTRDRIAVGGKTYDVKSINNLATKDEEALYKIRVRGL